MSGLAHILLDLNVEVSGTDSKDSEALDCLAARGARVATGHAADAVRDVDLLVFSSAVAPDNPELASARDLGVRTCRRGEFLAQLATHFDVVIAVAGSHGKTTTTAMLAYIFRQAGRAPGFLVGGDVNGWSRSAGAGAGELLIAEVDESDRTQALMRSTYAVVVNVEDDHCWSVGGVDALEQCFTEFANAAEHVITWDTAKTRELFAGHPDAQFVADADLPCPLTLGIPGEHNRTNATLAVVAAAKAGLDPVLAAAAVETFPGVARRLTERFRTPDADTVVIEDYAHHPTELRAALRACREAYPGYRLVTVFQPHRFERVKRYKDAFAEALSIADHVVVYRPFAAWLDDDSIADPRGIADAVKGSQAEFCSCTFTELAERLSVLARNDGRTLFAVVGAGDVADLLPPLRNCLARDCLNRMLTELRENCPHIAISRDRPWAQLTTLGIGRAKPLLACPRSESELRELLQQARVLRLPVMALGNGSNVLGADEEIPCLVVHPAEGDFAQTRVDDGCVEAGSGVQLHSLLRHLAADGRLTADAAPLAGIPGTVGGAVTMNAGAGKVSLGQFVERVSGVDHAGAPWGRLGSDITWGYRRTDIPDDVILTRVVLSFPPGDAQAAIRRLDQVSQERRRRQPTGHSAGSVFRNPELDTAGRLLDVSGCKGMSVGACVVSSKHANFFIAETGAAESDFLELLLRAQRRVYLHTQTLLEAELRFANPAAAARVLRHMAWLDSRLPHPL